MFSLNEFLMKTIKGMIGNYPDFQIREYAANWYAKGKLAEENLAEIDILIEAQYIVAELPIGDDALGETDDLVETELPEEYPEQPADESPDGPSAELTE